MDENERYVKERWDKAYEPIVQRGLMGIDIWVEGSRTYRFHADNLPAAWQAAFDFTKAREEEIRQVEEEISWLTERTEISPKLQELYDKRTWEFSAEFLKDKQTAKRILAREQAALAELQRGMKARR